MFTLFTKKKKQEPPQTNDDIKLGDWIQFQYHKLLTSLPTDSTLPSAAEKIRIDSVENLQEPVTWKELIRPVMAMGVELGVRLQLQAEKNIMKATKAKLDKYYSSPEYMGHNGHEGLDGLDGEEVPPGKTDK